MNPAELEWRSGDAARHLRQEVRRAPARSIAMALATGYVLGGGLTPRAVRLLLVSAGRALAGNLIAAAIRGTFDDGRTT